MLHHFGNANGRNLSGIDNRLTASSAHLLAANAEELRLSSQKLPQLRDEHGAVVLA